MPLCPYCHTVVSEDTRFCPECRRPLAVGEAIKGKGMNTKLKVFLIAIVIFSVGINLVLYANYRSLQEQTNSLKQEITTLQQEKSDLQDENNNLREENSNLQDENSNLKEELQGTLPYSKANGTPITLWNNLNGTHNPTWKELKNFLDSDNTESIRYDYNSFICGDFAERLHNNAERAGIRAAVVIVYFTSGPPHAIDAFYTTDKGLVYIDDTGASLKFVLTGYFYGDPVYDLAKGEDKVAYVSVGKEYGLIELSFADSTEYSFYTSYSAKITNYNEQVESYNAEVDAYNAALGGRVFLDEPEYSYFLNWYNRLEEERAELDRVASTLPDYYYKPMGIVSKVEIYWNTIKWNG
jgi:cell division protein FtsB